jgi:hypothetical protein
VEFEGLVGVGVGGFVEAEGLGEVEEFVVEVVGVEVEQLEQLEVEVGKREVGAVGARQAGPDPQG